MNIITRTRNALRAFTRAYSGYDVTGGSGKWPTSSIITAPTSQQLAAARLASRKIAWLVENSGVMSSAVQQIVTAINGDAPSVSPAHPDPSVKADLQARWNVFFANCDIEGTQSLGAYLNRVARGFYIDGESFTQFVVDPDTMRLKLRLLSADQVDSSKTMPSLGMTGDAPMIVAGVEHDFIGRVVAYWVFRTPLDAPWASVRPAVRIPAMDICHVFEPRFPGVPRGISPLVPIAGLAQELDQAIDACVVKLKTTALVTMIIRDLDGTALDIDTTVDPATLRLEPGATIPLAPGKDVTFPPVADMASTSEVLKHMTRLVCAGAGVPYFMAAGDLADVNYSAGKMGLATFLRRVKAIQQNHIVAQLLNPIWQRFVLLEVLSGRMRAADYETNPEYYATSFLFPGWPALDEQKKAAADTANLAARLRSRTEIIAESGRDIADVDEEIASDPYAVEIATSNNTNQPAPSETKNA